MADNENPRPKQRTVIGNYSSISSAELAMIGIMNNVFIISLGDDLSPEYPEDPGPLPAPRGPA